MLELRPVCEHCGRALPPAATEARICSFECTFCADCVERVLGNVCPNCGGGFVPRPIRPAREWRSGACLGAHPPAQRGVHRPVDAAAHAALVAAVASIPPAQR